MKKAVIFDLDGTLTDTLGSIAAAGNEMLAGRGYGPQPLDAYRYYAGDGARTLVRRLLAASQAPDLEAELPQALEDYLEIFARTCTQGVAPFPGIVELLEQLRARGVATAVLSNKPQPMTLAVVEQFFGPGRFTVVQGQTPEIPPKPDQAGVRAVLQRLGLKPQDCLYVGDTDTDMDTGRLAGMETVGVLWGFRGQEELLAHGAQHLILQPAQLLDLLAL